MQGYASIETVEQAARDAARRNAGGSMPGYVSMLPPSLYDAFCQAYRKKSEKAIVCMRKAR